MSIGALRIVLLENGCCAIQQQTEKARWVIVAFCEDLNHAGSVYNALSPVFWKGRNSKIVKVIGSELKGRMFDQILAYRCLKNY